MDKIETEKNEVMATKQEEIKNLLIEKPEGYEDKINKIIEYYEMALDNVINNNIYCQVYRILEQDILHFSGVDYVGISKNDPQKFSVRYHVNVGTRHEKIMEIHRITEATAKIIDEYYKNKENK